MFAIKDPEIGVISFTSVFDFSKLVGDGKFSLIVEAFEVENPDRKSRVEVLVPFAVDRFPPVFEKPFYTQNIPNPKVSV